MLLCAASAAISKATLKQRQCVGTANQYPKTENHDDVGYFFVVVVERNAQWSSVWHGYMELITRERDILSEPKKKWKMKNEEKKTHTHT